jgi:hypothetical protein
MCFRNSQLRTKVAAPLLSLAASRALHAERRPSMINLGRQDRQRWVELDAQRVRNEAEAPVPATAGAPGASAGAVAAPPVAAVPLLEPASPPRTEPEPAIAENMLPEPEDPRPVPELPHTPSGLPFRVPQASLAPPLRNGRPVTESRSDGQDPGRSPEEIRRIVGSYQRGTLRGRFDAGELDAAPDGSANDDRPPA